MELGTQNVLVTGGGSGIGLAIAARFLEAGSRVLVCGRREQALRAAQAQYPRLQTVVCDVRREDERLRLLEEATSRLPDLNVVVNNAGIQRRIDLQDADWATVREEIEINLEAPIHLSMLFARRLAGRPSAAIVNVTSGLAFVPRTSVPVYCATKAALHSFTLSLRDQLQDLGVGVIEVIPPAVDTDLGGPGLHTFGVPVAEFADAAMAQIAAGSLEASYGFASQASRASRDQVEVMFARINARPSPA